MFLKFSTLLSLLLLANTIEGSSRPKGCKKLGKQGLKCVIDSPESKMRICKGLQALRTKRQFLQITITDGSITHYDTACSPASVTMLLLDAEGVTDFSTDRQSFTKLALRSKALRRLPHELAEMEQLEYLEIEHLDLAPEDFEAIPKTIPHLAIKNTPMKSFPCEVLYSLKRLSFLEIVEARQMTSFDVSCLPADSIHPSISLDIYITSTGITSLDLLPLFNIPRFSVYINKSPSLCSCRLFRQYVKLLKVNRIRTDPETSRFQQLTCASGPLLGYDLGSTDVAALESFDRVRLNCLAPSQAQSLEIETREECVLKCLA